MTYPTTRPIAPIMILSTAGTFSGRLAGTFSERFA